MLTPGTNFYAPKNSTVNVALTDTVGDAVFIECTVANLPSAVAGYAKSCIARATDTGALYINTGTSSSATFSLVGTVSAGSVTSTELANGAVTTAKIAANAVDGTKIALAGQVLGDLMYYNGTDWVVIPIGTNGQVLTVVAGVPAWA